MPRSRDWMERNRWAGDDVTYNTVVDVVRKLEQACYDTHRVLKQRRERHLPPGAPNETRQTCSSHQTRREKGG